MCTCVHSIGPSSCFDNTTGLGAFVSGPGRLDSLATRVSCLCHVVGTVGRKTDTDTGTSFRGLVSARRGVACEQVYVCVGRWGSRGWGGWGAIVYTGTVIQAGLNKCNKREGQGAAVYLAAAAFWWMLRPCMAAFRLHTQSVALWFLFFFYCFLGGGVFFIIPCHSAVCHEKWPHLIFLVLVSLKQIWMHK